MSTVSITELKARLSEYLDRVKAGQEVVVTDRGRAVARLAPLTGAYGQRSRLDALVREGRVRPPITDEPLDLRGRRLPEDPDGRSLSYLLEERRTGR